MADYSPPTLVEHERMQGLRAMMRSAGLSLPHNMRLPGLGGEDRTILRFTRARKDTEKSFAMMKKSLQWREESGANQCLSEPLSEAHAATLAKIPGFYVGYGRNGHPVFLDHTAVVPWDTILHDMGMKTFLHAQVQCLEWMQMVVYQEASRRAGKPITQGINIWDMKGLTLAKFTAKVREISSATSRIAQDNYPESLAAAYVVNAPSYFTVIWAVIKSFLDPKTVAKVHIYGSGPKMFAKLKNALGPGCFIAEDMVCCKKSQVGAAELTMGLQSAMAASQTWIRERRESGIPWHAASAAESTTRLDGAGDDPSSATAGALTAESLKALQMGLLREDGHRTRSEDRDWDDETFFDAEDDAFTMFSSFAEEAAERDALEHSDGYARVPGGPTRVGARVRANGANGFDGGMRTDWTETNATGAKDPEFEAKDAAAAKRCCGCC